MRRKIESGFTTMEVLVASVLIVVLGMGILGLQVIISDSQVNTFNGSIAVDGANYSVSTISRELRTARQADSGSYPVVLADDNEIIFYSDIDFDDSSERVRYYLVDTILYKDVIEPIGYPATYPSGSAQTKIIVENVRNGAVPIFLYFNDGWPSDTANNPLPTPASLLDVKLIRISLRINPLENNPTSDFVLESYVGIRTLKDNLAE